MTKLLEIGNDYAERSDWTDFALLKACLCALGVSIGCIIPESKRKIVAMVAMIGFLAACIPLIIRLVQMLMEEGDE